jgi:hypothetical protein
MTLQTFLSDLGRVATQDPRFFLNSSKFTQQTFFATRAGDLPYASRVTEVSGVRFLRSSSRHAPAVLWLSRVSCRLLFLDIFRLFNEFCHEILNQFGNRCGYFLFISASGSHMNSGPLLAFHLTLTTATFFFLNLLTCLSIISTGYSLKLAIRPPGPRPTGLSRFRLISIFVDSTHGIHHVFLEVLQAFPAGVPQVQFFRLPESVQHREGSVFPAFRT